MATPSGAVLSNRVDIYKAVQGRAGTGVQFTYPDAPDVSAAPCSVQAVIRRSQPDDLARLSAYMMYDVHFGTNYSLKIRDKLIWKDSVGILRNLFVEYMFDDSGRGYVFTARCTEVQ